MKRFTIALVALFVLSVPAFAQESLLQRIEKLEASIAKVEATCKCGAAQAAQAVQQTTQAVQYQQVCENGVCRLVPVQGQQYQPTFQSDNQGGCANGSCGTARRGLFGRRR